MVTGENFRVTVKRTDTVAAKLPPLHDHWLPLTNLDLLLPPLDFSVFFCYKKSTTSSIEDMVGILKKALSEVLVCYYPLSGEVVGNCNGEAELLCNNGGVEFLEAYGDIELVSLNLYNPDESIEGKLVPKKTRGVLAVQATELKCGGLVVVCTFDHRISDGHSASMFLVSWAEIAQSKSISVPPSFRRSQLYPRHPSKSINSALDQMYVPISTLAPPEEPNPDDRLLSRIYYVKSQDLLHLQSLASSNGLKRTKLESFSAFLWQIVAKSTLNEAIEGDDDKVSNMGVVVNGRKFFRAKMMDSSFGNVLSIPYGSIKVSDLSSKPLSWVANEVHGFLEMATNEEHFYDLIDWMEAQRPEPVICRVYNSRKNDGPAFVVSSGQRFPVDQVDFGCGKPWFGSYHFPWGGRCGYVMPMPSLAVEGDWIVYMHMSKRQLEMIETVDSNLFKPVTTDYLNYSS